MVVRWPQRVQSDLMQNYVNLKPRNERGHVRATRQRTIVRLIIMQGALDIFIWKIRGITLSTLRNQSFQIQEAYPLVNVLRISDPARNVFKKECKKQKPMNVLHPLKRLQ